MPNPAAASTSQVTPSPVDSPAPVRLDWCHRAACLPGKTLHLALALLALAVHRQAPGVRLTRRTLNAWGISRDARYDALRRLQAAALIRSWQLPGRAPLVILTEPGTDQPLRLS